MVSSLSSHESNLGERGPRRRPSRVDSLERQRALIGDFVSNRGGFEPLEAVGNLWAALAFVRKLSYKKREGLCIPGSSQRTNVHWIEPDVLNQPSRHALGAGFVTVVDQARPIPVLACRKYTEEHLARVPC